MMADFLFNGAKERLVEGDLDWETVDLRGLLLKGSGYTPDADDDFVSDLTPASNECTATNYARVTLSGLSVVRVDASDLVRLLANNPVIASLGATDDPMEVIQGLVLYEYNVADAAARLVSWHGSMTKTLTGTTATFAFPGGVVATLS